MINLPRENVQSYPRPPALEPVTQRITIRLGGVLAAQTNHALRGAMTTPLPAMPPLPAMWRSTPG